MLNILEPSLVKYYNKIMEEVDRMDQNITYYRIQFRSKETDAAAQNSWLLYRKSTL